MNALTQQALIEVGKLRGALGELQRSRQVAVVFGLLRELLGGFSGHRTQSMPLTAEPIVEFGRVVGEEALQQRSAIELERCLSLPGVHRVDERGDVAPQDTSVDRQLLRAATHDCGVVGDESASQMAEGLLQRIARVRLIQIGPEQGEQRVAPNESTAGDRQVCEQGEALRLDQHVAVLLAVRSAEVELT